MSSIILLSIRLATDDLGVRAFHEGPIVIGRDPYTHVYLEDPLVSRRHATIQMVDDAYVLTDLGANGTFVNGQRIEAQTIIASGDEIRIGRFTLRVEIQRDDTLSQVPNPSILFEDENTIQST
jgi:predicted component of type VI protein secretion system